MTDTCILVTTFLRDKLLIRCIESIRKYYPDIDIYVGDNGYSAKEKTAFLTANNCTHFELPFDLGVGGTRNEALKQIPDKYKYVVIAEDDIVFTEGTRLEIWRKVLQCQKDIGIIGGLLKTSLVKDQHFEATTWIESRTHYIRKIEEPEWKDVDGTKYFKCDIILNVFMMKTSIWKNTQWDAQFKTALEHADFFLRLKYQTNKNQNPIMDGDNPVLRTDPIGVAYCPEVWMYHKHERDEHPQYAQYRGRPVGWVLFGKKWHVDFNNSSYNKHNPLPMILFGSSFNPKDMVMESAVRIFENHKIKWWLDACTCLGAIRDNNYYENLDTLEIGIPADFISQKDVLIKQFEKDGFTKGKEVLWGGKVISISFVQHSVKLAITFYYLQGEFMWHGITQPARGARKEACFPCVFPARFFADLKEIFFRGRRCFVPPMPEDYLTERFGSKWTEGLDEYIPHKDCKAIDRNFFKKNKTAFVCGSWELLHAGHLNLLEYCAKIATETIVGVYTDEMVTDLTGVLPIQQKYRIRLLRGVKGINRIISVDEIDPARSLKKSGIMPDYLVVGGYKDEVPGSEYVEKHDGKVVYALKDKNLITANIRKKMVLGEPSRNRQRRKLPSGDGEIAIGIKTFLRETTMLKTLKAIEENFPIKYRLYIADDGRISDDKALVYQKLKQQGHVIITPPFNSGISVGRNRIVQAILDKGIEQYVLIMDDDIIIDDPDSIKNMKSVLDYDESVGLVSGMLMLETGSYYAHSKQYNQGLKFENRDGVLIRSATPQIIHEAGKVKYVYADQVVNFFLAKVEIFRDVRWDNCIKVEYEHMDFFLEFGKTKWKAAACLDAQAIHIQSPIEPGYMIHRQSHSSNYFLQKHGLVRLTNQFQ